MILPEDRVVMLTNRGILMLVAPGFSQVQKAAEAGRPPTNVLEIPAAQVKWAVTWQDLLALEVRWRPGESYNDTPYPERVVVHRKGVPGQQESEPLAHEIRCWPRTPQADQLKVIALKVKSKYYTEEQQTSARWARRRTTHDELTGGLPKQEVPATMLSMDFKIAWYTDSANPNAPSFWRPVTPPGYKPVGDVVSLGFDPPAEPVQVYRDDSQRGEKPPTTPPVEFHLLWRHNGRRPVTMWEPIPPVGYRALGTVVMGAPEQPNPEDVLCVRQDLCQQSGVFDAPIWRYQPAPLTGGLARTRAIYPENWPCSCWQVDNPAGTFIATRSLHKPVKEAALTPAGIK
jgi:vacuolar protein sorting-associated protein 13A/C